MASFQGPQEIDWWLSPLPVSRRLSQFSRRVGQEQTPLIGANVAYAIFALKFIIIMQCSKRRKLVWFATQRARATVQVGNMRREPYRIQVGRQSRTGV
jgi:hypothetical protein